MKQEDEVDPVPDHVLRAILAYLRVHRAASDTARGVHQWWLRELAPPPSEAEVLAALETLERGSFVRRWVNPDGTFLWGAGGALDAGS